MTILDENSEPDHPRLFACNTSMIESDDLNMYVDIIDELGKRIDDLTLKNDRIKKKAASTMSRLEQNQTPVQLPTRLSRSLQRTEKVVRMSRSSDANDRMITEKLDQQQQLAHHEFQQQFDQIFSYFDKDVDVGKSSDVNEVKMRNMVKSGSDSSKLPKSKEETADTSRRYSCKITDVVYKKSPTRNTSRRFSSCNRLTNLVNMFENLTSPQKVTVSTNQNISYSKFTTLPAKKIVQKDKAPVCMEAMKKAQINYKIATKKPQHIPTNKDHTSDEDLQPRKVKDMIQLFNQRSLVNGCQPLKPTSPSNGKFATSRKNLDKFFKDKIEPPSERSMLKTPSPTHKVNRFDILDGSSRLAINPERNEAFQKDLKNKVGQMENATIFANSPSPPQKPKQNIAQFLCNQKQQKKSQPESQSQSLLPRRDTFVFPAENIRCSKCVHSKNPSPNGKNTVFENDTTETQNQVQNQSSRMGTNIMNFEGYNEGMQQKPLLNQVQNFAPTKLPQPKQTNNCTNSSSTGGSLFNHGMNALTTGAIKKINNVSQQNPTLLTITESADKVESTVALTKQRNCSNLPAKATEIGSSSDMRLLAKRRFLSPDLITSAPISGRQSLPLPNSQPFQSVNEVKRDLQSQIPIAAPPSSTSNQSSASSISVCSEVLATPLLKTSSTSNNTIDDLDYENFERNLPRAPIYNHQHRSQTEPKRKIRLSTFKRHQTSMPETPMMSEIRKLKNSAQAQFIQFNKQLNNVPNELPSASMANATPPANEHPIVRELRNIEKTAHDTFTKYNKLRALQSFVLTQEFMEKCHDVCTQMSVTVLDGLEYDMEMQKECLYEYIDGLAQDTLNAHFQRR